MCLAPPSEGLKSIMQLHLRINLALGIEFETFILSAKIDFKPSSTAANIN